MKLALKFTIEVLATFADLIKEIGLVKEAVSFLVVFVIVLLLF